MQASLSEIKPSFAKVIKKFHHPNQYDFIEDKDYIYLLKLKAIHYKPIANKEEILKKIKEEKIKDAEYIATEKDIADALERMRNSK